MSSKANDPAFPQGVILKQPSGEAYRDSKGAVFIVPSGGLTKREYFAGLAMQNLQNVLLRKSGQEMLQAFMAQLGCNLGSAVIAKLAVIQADALIAELDRSTP